MKTLKMVVIIVVLLLAVLCIGAWVALSTLDVNRYIPEVADAVAKATGRQLTVGRAELAFSLSKGAALELKDVRLSDAPQFSDKPFLTVDRILLVLDVRATLAQRSAVVSEVNIISPKLSVIRAKNGSINAAVMGAPAAVQPPGQPSAPSTGNAAVAALPGLLVKKIEVRDGIVHYIDRSFEPALAVDIEKCALDIKDFSLAGPFDIVLSAAVFSSDENVRATGRGSLDMARVALRLDGMKVVGALDKIQSEKFNASLPMLRPVFLKQAGGQVNIYLKQAVIGAKGLEGLDAEISFQARNVVLEGANILAAGLNSIPLPGLMDRVLGDLPLETQADIKKGIATIDRLDVSAKADNDRIMIQRAELSTRDFGVEASGTVSLAGELDISANLLIAAGISDVLVGKVADLDGLRKEDKRIDVPFSISGPAGAPKVRPDVEYLTKKLLFNKGKQELQKVLGDAKVGEAVGELLNSLFKGK